MEDPTHLATEIGGLGASVNVGAVDGDATQAEFWDWIPDNASAAYIQRLKSAKHCIFSAWVFKGMLSGERRLEFFWSGNDTFR